MVNRRLTVLVVENAHGHRCAMSMPLMKYERVRALRLRPGL
jgi:hypothetical protein